MEISEYVWKKQKQIVEKNNKIQNSVRMIDMSEEELKTAYNHCKQMLFNDEKTSLGRYLVLQEINKQIQYCNAELAVRWFLEELTKDNGSPYYTRFSLTCEIENFINREDIKRINLSELTLNKIYNGLPTNFENVPLDIFLKACRNLLGTFNRSHLTNQFILSLGVWFNQKDIMDFKNRNLESLNDRLNDLKSKLKLKSDTVIPVKATGLCIEQFSAIVNIRANIKYTDLSILQLETLRDSVLFTLADTVRRHIKQWETLMCQIEEVCTEKKIEL